MGTKFQILKGPPHSSGLIIENYPGTMSLRGPHSGGSTGEKKLASSSDIFLQPNLDSGRLNSNRTRWHGVGRVPKLHWKNKCLLPVSVALIFYGIMRLRLHVPLALLFVTSATEPVIESCPSYTEYSKVDTSYSCPRWHKYDPRTRMERRQRVYSVSHICDQTPPAEPSRVPWWR